MWKAIKNKTNEFRIIKAEEKRKKRKKERKERKMLEN